MTRMATASVFRTRADADAREPVFEEPRNRGWGWKFETRGRLAATKVTFTAATTLTCRAPPWGPHDCPECSGAQRGRAQPSP